MSKYIKVVFRLKTIIKYNMIIYYLRKVPIVGEYLYSLLVCNEKIKKIIASITTIFAVAWRVIVKLGCVAIFILFPFLWYILKEGFIATDYSSYYIQAVFFFFCILGSFQESRTFLITKIKHICLTHMKMPIKEGILAFLIIEYAIQFVSIIFVFGICNRYQIISTTNYCVALFVSYVALQLFSESLHLHAFKRKGIPLEKNKIFSMILFAVSLLGAYGPIFLSDKILIVDILVHRITIIAMAIIAVASILYIFFYKGYNDELAKVFRKEDLVEELVKKNQEKLFRAEVPIELKHSKNVAKMKGFRLLNSLFVIRNKKSLDKYFKRRLTLWILLFAVVVCCLIYNFKYTQYILENIYAFAPLLPLILCQYAYGEGFCKFYYMHCDSKLFSFNFFRTKKALLENYFYKIRRVTRYNLAMFVIMLISLLIVMSIAKISIWNYKFFMYIITILLLLVVFGIQHVSLYYLIQPYVLGSIIQNPFMIVVQIPMIALAYIITVFEFEIIITLFVFMLCAIIYAFILVMSVYHKGVSTFKLK